MLESLAALLAPLVLIGVASTAPEEDFDPTRFEVAVLARGLDRPMELDVAPDGRVLWIELAGALRLYRPDTGAVLEAGRLDVFVEQENGLLGLALDPDFATNRRLFLLYSPPDYPGQRLSRFVLDGDRLDLGSEQVLFEFEEQRRECCHHAGALEFGPDGLLFLSTGDNTHPGGDSQGYAPIDERPERSPFDAQKGPANTQNLSGKILRIRPTETGYEIPPGNLFADPSEGRPEIYVMGCRNPWRIGVDAETGHLYWGEVGPDAWSDGDRGPRGYDELNQARAAGNFGWPYFIGDNEAYRDVDFATGEIGAPYDAAAPRNDSPHNTGARVLPPAQPAWLYYPYGASGEFPELNGEGGRTACAGPVYHFDPALESKTKLPAYFDRTFFAFEWSRHWIRAVHLDDDSNPARIEPFLPERTFKRPVDLVVGPEGALYLLEFGTTWGTNEDSALVRIDYRSGNRAPRVRAAAENAVGPLPLTVRLSTAGTHDPDGDPLELRWLDQAGEPLAVAGPADAPTITFDRPGTFQLQLEARDPHGAVARAAVPVIAGNARPTIAFERPRHGGFYEPDEPVDWLVRVTDAEDGDSRETPLELLDHVVVEATFHAGAPPTGGAADDDPALAAMRRSDCFQCHAVDRRVVGPAYLEVAERYRDDPDAVEAAVARVRDGSTGVWGEVPMLPHRQHPVEEVREMVRWVLGREASAPAESQQRGLRGLVVPPSPTGTFVLRARYTDAGAEGAPPLEAVADLVVRGRAVEAEHLSSRAGTRTLDSETATGGRFVGAIDSGNHLRFADIDLAGIDRVSLRVSSAGAGATLALRVDGVEGPVLAEVDIVPNGDWEDWYEVVLPIRDPGGPVGARDLFVTFQHAEGKGGLMNLDRLHFLRPDDPVDAETEPGTVDEGR